MLGTGERDLSCFVCFLRLLQLHQKLVTPAPKTRMGGLNGHALCDLIFHLPNGASSEKFIETLFFCSNIKAYKHKHTHMKDTTYIYVCAHWTSPMRQIELQIQN